MARLIPENRYSLTGCHKPTSGLVTWDSDMNYSPPALSGIYALTCPHSGEVRYIGQSKNIKARYRQHLKPSGHSPKDSWVKSLRASGEKPGISVLEITDKLDEAEKIWISKFVDRPNLLNLNSGGRYHGIEDPKPWRVRGVSCPSKLMAMVGKNMGCDKSVMDMVTKVASEIEDTSDRLAYELKIADLLSTTRLEGKIRKWFYVVMPRIEANYPELMN